MKVKDIVKQPTHQVHALNKVRTTRGRCLKHLPKGTSERLVGLPFVGIEEDIRHLNFENALLDITKASIQETRRALAARGEEQGQRIEADMAKMEARYGVVISITTQRTQFAGGTARDPHRSHGRYYHYTRWTRSPPTRTERMLDPDKLGHRGGPQRQTRHD